VTTIRVVDFETTGMEPPAEVIEVGYCDLVRGDDGEWGEDAPQSWLCGADKIPPETRAIHHISIDEVRGLERFSADGFIQSSIHCSAIAAHNLDFENKWLKLPADIPAICTYKSALRVWPEAPSHSNGALRYWLEDQGLLSLTHDLAMPPHRAGPDAYVTAHLLKALFATGATGKDMVAWTKEPRLFPTCPIGEKWRGKPWSEVDAGFLGWMIRQPTMEDDLKWNANREIARRQGA
jgi:exodeoxyribonuclease X